MTKYITRTITTTTVHYKAYNPEQDEMVEKTWVIPYKVNVEDALMAVPKESPAVKLLGVTYDTTTYRMNIWDFMHYAETEPQPARTAEDGGDE